MIGQDMDAGRPDRDPAALEELCAAMRAIEDALLDGVARPLPEGTLRALREAGEAAGREEASGKDETAASIGGQSAPVGGPSVSAAEGLAAGAARAASCCGCSLAASRKNVVYGQGVPEPVVLVIGEGPGAEEDARGLPFVGASGHLLDRMLASIGLSRDTNCYIANIVKCRPPDNREPSPDERYACLPFLVEQIRLLRPRAILCAGRTAAQALLSSVEGINRLRGRELSWEGIPVVASYHPSALLRDESLKRPAWEDLKRLRSIISA